MPKRNGNGRMAVRTSPKAPATRPSLTFTRTLRQTQRVLFSNVAGIEANLQAVIKADPRSFVDWITAAAPFEMFRVKRLRVHMLPTTATPASIEILLRTIASTVVWTAPDYTNDETALGINIKSYQNARFHSVSLNGFKKIADTDVRLNSVQGGVLPASTWLPCSAANAAGGWNPDELMYTGLQLYAENNALLNVSPDLQGGLTLVYEIDVEFKQPGFSRPPLPGINASLPGRVTINETNQELLSNSDEPRHVGAGPAESVAK